MYRDIGNPHKSQAHRAWFEVVFVARNHAFCWVDFAARNAAHGFGLGQIFRADSVLFTKRVALRFSLLLESISRDLFFRVFFTLSIPAGRFAWHESPSMGLIWHRTILSCHSAICLSLRDKNSFVSRSIDLTHSFGRLIVRKIVRTLYL